MERIVYCPFAVSHRIRAGYGQLAGKIIWRDDLLPNFQSIKDKFDLSGLQDVPLSNI
jgi:hypothetical protein